MRGSGNRFSRSAASPFSASVTLLVLGVAASVSGPLSDVLWALTNLVMLATAVSFGLLATIALFNRPKSLVPPHARDFNGCDQGVRWRYVTTKSVDHVRPSGEASQRPSMESPSAATVPSKRWWKSSPGRDVIVHSPSSNAIP